MSVHKHETPDVPLVRLPSQSERLLRARAARLQPPPPPRLRMTRRGEAVLCAIGGVSVVLMFAISYWTS